MFVRADGTTIKMRNQNFLPDKTHFRDQKHFIEEPAFLAKYKYRIGQCLYPRRPHEHLTFLTLSSSDTRRDCTAAGIGRRQGVRYIRCGAQAGAFWSESPYSEKKEETSMSHYRRELNMKELRNLLRIASQ
jgi:hypothetical protein